MKTISFVIMTGWDDLPSEKVRVDLFVSGSELLQLDQATTHTRDANLSKSEEDR